MIKIDDLIIGVDGKKFRKPHRNGYGMEVFGAEGPMAELAEALEACQAKSATGKLKLMVKRGDETIDVELDIGKEYGSYAATYPAACPKSEKILGELLDYITKQQEENGSFGDPVHNTFSALALLGSGEKKYLPDVERNLRHLCESIKATDEGTRKDGLMNWTYMGTAIVLSEYYLITKKSWVLPELEKIRDLLYEGQYLDMSQINPKVKESHPDSYPTGPKQAHGGWGHNPGFEGYGPIAMITAQGALTYSLMHRCGIEIDRKRHDAAYEFLKRGTGENGYVWYGDSRRRWAGRLGGHGPDRCRRHRLLRQPLSRRLIPPASPTIFGRHRQASAKLSRHPRLAAHGHGLRGAGGQYRTQELPQADGCQPLVVHHGSMRRWNLLLSTQSRQCGLRFIGAG